MEDDFRFTEHGSVWLFHPLTDAAREWLEATAPDDAQFLGDALAVEHRYVPGVIRAIQAAGLTIE